MKIKTLILILIICLATAGCNKAKVIITSTTTQEASKNVTQIPNPTIVSPSSTPTMDPTLEATPSPIIYEPLPAPDTSYVDDSIRPAYIVFDDDYMYYIDGLVIKKRHMQTGEETIIFDGVYDNEYLSIQDGWLYFYTRGSGIVKIKTDGTKMEVIRNVQAREIIVAGDYIYYNAIWDPFYDWEYSLYELNLKTNIISRIHRFGVDAIFTDKKLYYTSYDGMQNDLWYYNINTNTKEHKSSQIDCYGIPLILNDFAYYFYDDWMNNSNHVNSLYINSINTNQEKKLAIDGHSLTQYYNYLLYIDENDNLNAFDTKTEETYCLMPFKDKWIKAIHDDIIYISNDIVINAFDIFALDINEKVVSEVLFSIEPNYKYDFPQSHLLKLSELETDKNWSGLPYGIYEHSWCGDDIIPVISNENKYYCSFNDTQSCIFVDDGTKKKIIIENASIIEDFPGFIIVNETIYYHSDENLGYLYAYDLDTKKTKEYETGMGYPMRYLPYYQYLIMDSYYKDKLEPIYSIAFNMETGEIIQVENDLSD